MRKSFLILLVLLSLFSVQANSLAAQSNDGNVTLLNRENQAVTQITDGDTVRIQVTPAQPVQATQNIFFTFDDPTVILGSCTIPAGKTSCTTDPLPALGWYWNAAGISQPTRILHAATEDQQLLGSSQPIQIKPRPVVMVHGFISNWQTWNKYLGPDVIADVSLLHPVFCRYRPFGSGCGMFKEQAMR